jgi:pimeloyl-ACP methyl ester carboxylesterase
VVSEAQSTLAEAGFAVIGFTDTLNRELGQDLDHQNTVLFQTLILERRFPHFPMQTYGDQMAFLRVIEQLGSLDRVPLAGGDGVPDLDLEAPLTYVGLSMGSVHGSAFLSYAPEIKAAALVAGAQRQAEQYFNGGEFIDIFPSNLAALLPNVTPTDYWVGLSIFQMIFDHQDAEQHAAFLYRNRLEVVGTTLKASVLFQEGVGDMGVPSNATRSLAWTFGPIPHLEPVWDPTPILEPITGPVTGNIDPETTAAFYQFVAAGVSGVPPTPGCENEPNGHFCAQDAPAAQLQRTLFLKSAVEQAAPTIVDPLPRSN